MSTFKKADTGKQPKLAFLQDIKWCCYGMLAQKTVNTKSIHTTKNIHYGSQYTINHSCDSGPSKCFV